MIRKSVYAFALLLLVSTTAQARSTDLQRGGLGFLFPDHNSFVNPGQFATTHASALQFAYEKQNQTGGSQGLGAGFVYGNGTMGLGLAGSRVGTSLSESGSYIDAVTAGLGFGLMKERMTIGASYSRGLTSGSGDGDLGVTLTLQGARRMGASFGVGYRRTLGANLQSAVVGFGYGFKSSNSVELNVDFNDLNNVDDFTASGFFNLGRGWFYMGAGYSYFNSASVHSGAARVGFVLGKVDLSATVAAPFTSGGTLTYGGTLRAAF